MIHAYPESCLSKAKENLGFLFDYLINDCKFKPDDAYELFIASGLAELIEMGFTETISGMSAKELANKVIKAAHQDNYKPQTFSGRRSPEYWAGYTLLEYQYQSGRRFIDILSKKSFEDIIKMYPIYHSLPTANFTECLEKEFSEMKYVSKLKLIREARGISQSELAKRSEVNIRNIQMYEQGNNDIDKAQAQAIYKMAVILGCKMEDLLENPMK